MTSITIISLDDKLEPWQWENLTEWTPEGREVMKTCTCGRRIGWNGHPYYWCKTS